MSPYRTLLLWRRRRRSLEWEVPNELLPNGYKLIRPTLFGFERFEEKNRSIENNSSMEGA